MGSRAGGGYSASGSSTSAEAFADNVDRVTKVYALTEHGYFGAPGQGKARRIDSNDPESTAKHFFETLGAGGDVTDIGKGSMSVFDDGTHVTYRPTSSSDGSPVVEIVVKTPHSALKSYQKIHFVKGSGS